MPTSAGIKWKHTHGFKCSAIGRVYLHDTVNSEYRQNPDWRFALHLMQVHQMFCLVIGQHRGISNIISMGQNLTRFHLYNDQQGVDLNHQLLLTLLLHNVKQMFAVVQCSRSIHHCSQRIELHQHNF